MAGLMLGNMAGLLKCSYSVDSHFVAYFILYSYGNKNSLNIASIYLCTSRSRSIATADPPYAKQ